MIEKVRLGELCRIQGGYAFKSNQFQKNNIPIIRIGNIQENKVLIDNDICYTKEFLNSHPEFEIKNGDLLIAMSGATVGKVGIYSSKESALLNQRVGKFVITDKIESRYLYFLLLSPLFEKFILNNAFGCAQPNISNKQIEEFKFNKYSIETQIEIANKLDKVQEIIDLRKKQTEELDELIKSQFVEMFLKNEFPKEKLENNVEEMFIGPFGSALKNECFVEENNGYCVVYEQKHAIYKNIEDFRWVDKDKYESLKRFNVQPKDIIVSCRGTIGKTFVIPENAPLGIMHPSIMKIRLKKEKYIPEFFEMVLQHYFLEKENQTNGATIKMGIKASTLEKEDFIIPDMELQIKYLTFVKQIDKQKFLIEKSLKETKDLQESLMNKYFL